MRSFSTLLTGAALVAAAVAKVAITDYPHSVQVGQTYTVKYEPASASVSLVLRQGGDSLNLDNLGDVKATCSNGACSWTVSKSLPNGQQYALQIVNTADASDNNYSANNIAVGGSTATASASGASSASASASTSASAKSSGSTLSTTASVSMSTGASSNSTVSLPTLSSSKASAASTAKSTGSSVTTTGSGAPQNTGAAPALGSSPLALIFGAVAAMAYIN